MGPTTPYRTGIGAALHRDKAAGVWS